MPAGAEEEEGVVGGALDQQTEPLFALPQRPFPRLTQSQRLLPRPQQHFDPGLQLHLVDGAVDHLVNARPQVSGYKPYLLLCGHEKEGEVHLLLILLPGLDAVCEPVEGHAVEDAEVVLFINRFVCLLGEDCVTVRRPVGQKAAVFLVVHEYQYSAHRSSLPAFLMASCLSSTTGMLLRMPRKPMIGSPPWMPSRVIWNSRTVFSKSERCFLRTPTHRPISNAPAWLRRSM